MPPELLGLVAFGVEGLDVGEAAPEGVFLVIGQCFGRHEECGLVVASLKRIVVEALDDGRNEGVDGHVGESAALGESCVFHQGEGRGQADGLDAVELESYGFLVGVPVDALVIFVARRAAPNEGGARTARSGAGHVRGTRATTFG